MSVTTAARRRFEAALVQGLGAGLNALPWSAALAIGAGLGDGARRLGLRVQVARDNLARAFPERSPAERESILAGHYRELGRNAAEYPRLASLVRAPDGEVVAEARGLEHLDRARNEGRGALLVSGHYGMVELLGAWLGKRNPVSFVVQPLSNTAVDGRLARWRAEAGVETIPLGSGVRRAYQRLRENRWVAMLVDQDARRRGVFVPFFGRLASTPAGVARFALATGAPIVMGFASRRPDGRHVLDVDPPLAVADPRAPDAVRNVTAALTARLEQMIRARPEMWFWVHRRWKTRPPAGAP